MQKVLIDSSVVILANDVNLSIFKPLWLLKTGIFREEELQGEGLVVAPLTVNIQTGNFVFTVLPNRIQVGIPRTYPGAASDLERILGSIVWTLPHTPYTAVGLNFHYLAAPENAADFVDWNRRLCGCSLADRILESSDDAPLFGTYFSYDVLSSRLKLDVKPTKAESDINQYSESWSRGQDLLRVSFNFHHDVSREENRDTKILEAIQKWEKASETADQIIRVLEE